MWSALGIFPTSDPAEIRRARGGVDGSSADDVPPARRAAAETALIWATLGHPPDALGGWTEEALLQAIEPLLARSEGPASDPRSATDCARFFWNGAGFTPTLREGAEALHPDVELLATAIDRGAEPEEQARFVADLLSHPSLQSTELAREVELLLPILLLRGACPQAIDLVSSHYGWRRFEYEWNPLHRILVANLEALVHAASMIEDLRDQADGWWRSWPRDPEPLAAEALTSGFRPTLFLYASCSERVWLRMQQYWDELTRLPASFLRHILGPETHDYWARRLTGPPPSPVAFAQRLQVPVLLLSLLIGFGIVAVILAPRPAFASSTLVIAVVSAPIVWGTVLAGHLSLFAVVRLWDAMGRRSSQSDDDEGRSME